MLDAKGPDGLAKLRRNLKTVMLSKLTILLVDFSGQTKHHKFIEI